MLLPSQHRELTETYRQVYFGEVDDITDVMIEEVVEELIGECLELGYELEEAADIVEFATTEYLMELNPYAPAGSKEARAYQKSTTSTKRGEARKAAVKGAVERVKSVGRTAKAVAGVAGSIAKDEARRAGRGAAHAATKAAGAVSAAASKKKAEVKQGVKSLLGRGLRKAAGAAGVVAQKARKAGAAAGRAAERLGEEAHQLGEGVPLRGTTPDGKPWRVDPSPVGARQPKKMERNPKERTSPKTGDFTSMKKGMREEIDVFDVVLEYLLDTGHAETISEAQYIMSQMDSESIDSMLDEAMTNYEKNRKRAAQRAAARNEARREGKTGVVPGVGYVTPRMERETWTDERGKTRHAKGL